MQQVKVSVWGDSLGFRIPRGVADSLNIRAGDTLELLPSEGGVVIKKTVPARKSYRLNDIIDCFTPASKRSEVDFGEARGEELW